jgi:hypothetical protein
MDHPQPYSDEALRQRFRELSESLHQLHASWREAYRQHDVAHQIDLIDRELALLTQLRRIIAAFQQTMQARQACSRQPLERMPC